MIAFDQGNTRFNFRVAAVIIDRDRALLQRAEIDAFWSLSGGRVEFLEDSPGAIVHEMREELGIEMDVDRLLWVAENFFTHQAVAYHEICLYYLMKLEDSAPGITERETFFGLEEPVNYRLIFRWFPLSLSPLQSVPILPAFLAAGLLSLPDNTRHLTEIG